MQYAQHKQTGPGQSPCKHGPAPPCDVWQTPQTPQQSTPYTLHPTPAATPQPHNPTATPTAQFPLQMPSKQHRTRATPRSQNTHTHLLIDPTPTHHPPSTMTNIPLAQQPQPKKKALSADQQPGQNLLGSLPPSPRDNTAAHSTSSWRPSRKRKQGQHSITRSGKRQP